MVAEGVSRIVDHIQLLLQGLPGIDRCMMLINRGRTELLIDSGTYFLLIVDNQYTSDWIDICRRNGIDRRVITM